MCHSSLFSVLSNAIHYWLYGWSSSVFFSWLNFIFYLWYVKGSNSHHVDIKKSVFLLYLTSTMVSSILRYFPFGIVFLVAGKILEMSDPSAMGKKLGFYAVTVVFGLVLHGLFILPAMYFFITKKSPIVYIRGILQALLIALATSSR